MKLSIKVKAGSHKNHVSIENHAIVVRVISPARDGKANTELVRFLSTLLSIPKRDIVIAGGQGSPFKRLEMPDEACARLRQLAALQPNNS